jgi:hypothetical protein
MSENQNDLPVWVGTNYKAGGILIVGESPHAKPGVDTSQYNVLMAMDHMDGYRDRFRTKLVRAFLGRGDETLNDITAFWHSVAYFNYIKIPLSGPRIPPSITMWETMHEDLSARLECLRPGLLVALGYRMWDRWKAAPPCVKEPGPSIPGAAPGSTYWLTPRAGVKVLAYCMRHPSSAFSWRKEYPLLQAAIELAGRKRM